MPTTKRRTAEDYADEKEAAILFIIQYSTRTVSPTIEGFDKDSLEKLDLSVLNAIRNEIRLRQLIKLERDRYFHKLVMLGRDVKEDDLNGFMF